MDLNGLWDQLRREREMVERERERERKIEVIGQEALDE